MGTGYSKLLVPAYPHLNDFTGKLNFRYYTKVDPLNLESQNRVPQSKFKANWSKGS